MKASVVCFLLVSLLFIVFSRGNESSDLMNYDEIVLAGINDTDLNKDGYIDLEEYRIVTKSTVDSVPSEFDNDGDGKYDFEEYQEELMDYVNKKLFE